MRHIQQKYLRPYSLFLWICLVNALSVLGYHLWIEHSTNTKSFPDGFFGLLGMETRVALMDNPDRIPSVKTDGFFVVARDFKGNGIAIQPPHPFEIIDVSKITQAVFFKEWRTDDIYEVTNTDVFKITGSIEWRFFDWGIIGGSTVKAIGLQEFFETVLPPRRETNQHQDRFNKDGLIPDTSARIPFTSPFWTTIFWLLLYSACWVKQKYSTKKLAN